MQTVDRIYEYRRKGHYLQAKNAFLQITQNRHYIRLFNKNIYERNFDIGEFFKVPTDENDIGYELCLHGYSPSALQIYNVIDVMYRNVLRLRDNVAGITVRFDYTAFNKQNNVCYEIFKKNKHPLTRCDAIKLRVYVAIAKRISKWNGVERSKMFNYSLFECFENGIPDHLLDMFYLNNPGNEQLTFTAYCEKLYQKMSLSVIEKLTHYGIFPLQEHVVCVINKFITAANDNGVSPIKIPKYEKMFDTMNLTQDHINYLREVISNYRAKFSISPMQ